MPMTEGALFSFSFNEILSKIPVSVLWLVLVVFVILSLIAGSALMFHWKKYKLYSPATNATQMIYLLGLLILIVLCGISLSLFNM